VVKWSLSRWVGLGTVIVAGADTFAQQSKPVRSPANQRIFDASAWIALGVAVPMSPRSTAQPQQAGSIRGVVYDREFDAPLAGAQVTIAETGQRVTTTDQGHYVFSQVSPGTYTLVFSKDGYARQVKGNVAVAPGRLTDVDATLSGEFTEMEEFVAQDVQIGGSESALLQLRDESPALMDSIGADLISKAGASDAAAALNLVTGATVQDGKFAVIRGLPDRYVNSQLNGVRLPTADEDKRAVELDQYPAAIIESIQVSKTFTPDQQGDASGGAVNVVLKGIPDETTLQFKSQIGYNSQASGRDDFLTYKGGGVTYWGDSRSDLAPQPVGTNWTGAVGVSRGDAPIDSKWSFSGGTSHELDGVKIGGYASFFHENDSSFFDNGIDNSLWVMSPGAPMTPQLFQFNTSNDFKTSLLDITQGTQLVQLAGLGAAGIETENHQVGVAYLYTKTSEDTATLAEDTRGKALFFPGYNPDDLTDPGNAPDNIFAAPYLRTETLQFTERTTNTLMINGRHTLSIDDFGIDDVFLFHSPEIDWIYATSSAKLDQPDKRQFGSLFLPENLNADFGILTPAQFQPYKPAENFLLGNLQRIYKEIEESSDQYAINLKLPFAQWTEDDGYIKFGVFDDHLTRTFNQDTFSNFNDNTGFLAPNFETFWSAFFPSQNHPITDGPPFVDVDYDGDQNISAWYGMADLPLTSYLNLIGGARVETTSITIRNFPEANATWFPPGSTSPIALLPGPPGQLGPADVDFHQDDLLPAIAFELRPIDEVTLRGSYAQTVARQTFKELTPVIQQEFLGGPIFIGNPDLQMSNLQNFDLRLDYAPYEGALVSASWFHKKIANPIEYVQRVASGFTFTTPVNFPEGVITGYEFEVRQDLGHFWEEVQGLAIGANATFIDSDVTLSADEAAQFNAPNIMAPMSSRPMTDAPEYLYNLYLTYESELTGTEVGIFYTVKGDTLVAGAGQSDGNFIPDVYALEYGTLNLTVTQKLGKNFSLVFQAKNLTNPKYETVYRSPYIGPDVLKSSYTSGIELTIGLNASFVF
jgi:outer membrane receptor protein involved in Fe transport